MVVGFAAGLIVVDGAFVVTGALAVEGAFVVEGFVGALVVGVVFLVVGRGFLVVGAESVAESVRDGLAVVGADVASTDVGTCVVETSVVGGSNDGPVVGPPIASRVASVDERSSAADDSTPVGVPGNEESVAESSGAFVAFAAIVVSTSESSMGAGGSVGDVSWSAT